MILIAGAGAVGTILATHLAAAGRHVGLYARPQDRARFESVAELRVDLPGGGQRRAPRPDLVHTLSLEGVSILVLAVKFPALDALLDALPDPIPAHCTVVSTLNGVAPLRRIRERRPTATVVPMSVMMNMQSAGPLHVALTTRAEIVLGGHGSAAVRAAFEHIGLDLRHSQGDAGVWGKLLINLANAICALTRTTFRDLFLDRDLRRIYVAALDEATAVLDRGGIPWELPLAVPYGLYRWMLLHGGPLPWWVARLRNGVREGAYPSMVADVEAGRRTEVAQLNGEIVWLGTQLDIATPVNAGLMAHVEAAPGPARWTPGALRRALGL